MMVEEKKTEGEKGGGSESKSEGGEKIDVLKKYGVSGKLLNQKEIDQLVLAKKAKQ